MIVVDTSALMAILLEEPEAAACKEVLERESDIRISAGTLAETLIVASHRSAEPEMAQLIQELGLVVEVLSAARAERVASAHSRWGKGIHSARLNFGDCFAYALATELDCALLFRGDDFARTDVRCA